jgi:hypothetical protein
MGVSEAVQHAVAQYPYAEDLEPELAAAMFTTFRPVQPKPSLPRVSQAMGTAAYTSS